MNPTTGDWVFIEVNARFWGSLPLALAAGADFPLALYQFLMSGRTSFPERHRLGLCCRNWRLDRSWFSANFRANRSDPTLAARPLWRVFTETCANVIALRERSDCFTLDDPGPGVAEWRLMAGEVVAGVQRKVLRRDYRAGWRGRACIVALEAVGPSAACPVRLPGERLPESVCRAPGAASLGTRPDIYFSGLLPPTEPALPGLGRGFGGQVGGGSDPRTGRDYSRKGS